MTNDRVMVESEIRLDLAVSLYHIATDAIRARHDPPAPPAYLTEAEVKRWPKPENWDIATAHVLRAMTDRDAAAILRYLMTRPLLPCIDVILAEALATRLGQTISWQRMDLVAWLMGE